MEEKKPTRDAISILKGFLNLTMGLSPKTSADIVVQIRKSGELSDMKKHVLGIRGEALNQINAGLKKLKKQLDDAKDGDDEKDDAKPDFADVDKDGDKKEPVKKAAKEKGDDVKENYTFLNHLLNEVTLDVDLEDPATAMKTVKLAQRQGSERIMRSQKRQNKQDMRDASQSEGPTKTIDIQIARLKQQLATAQEKRARIAGK